jgi:hypothetical protein
MKQTVLLGAAMLALGLANEARAAAFQNGGFENPAGNGTVITFLNASTANFLPGWTHSEANSEFHVCGNAFGITAGEGNCYLGWGANGTTGGTLSQTFDTVIGDIYTVNYLLTTQQFLQANRPLQSNTVEAISGLTTLASVGNSFDMAAGVWETGSVLQFVADSTSTTLRFTDLTTSTNSGPINWGLDAITVTATSPVNNGPGVPEPSTYVMAAAGLGLMAYWRRRG